MAVIEIAQPKNNLTRLYVGNVVVWFSYDTPIAFHVPGREPVVSENEWGTTTGAHINATYPGVARTSRPLFMSLYNEAMEKVEQAIKAAFPTE